MIRHLYLITDEQLLPGRLLFDRVAIALEAGCRWLQYRNKTGGVNQRLREAEELKRVCERYGANLVVNDDVALAAVVGAGVHLGRDDTPVAEARARLGALATIGATCHASLPLARQAKQEGASYVAFGRFFPSRTKPRAPGANPALLSQARAMLDLPLVAIGGINRDNATQLLDAGAHALALCHDVFSLPGEADIAARVRAYSQLFPTY